MAKFINEVGKIYGRLNVIEYAGRSNTPAGGAQFKCVCQCGNERIVKGADLRAGRVLSCGCLYRESALKNLQNQNCPNLIDEIGNQYGNLTVVSFDHCNTSGNAYWLCKCSCGNNRIVAGSTLRKGEADTCLSCLTKSKGERKIQEILKNNNVKYKEQYVFDDLRSKNNRRLPFDIAVFYDDDTLRCLIEYQGEQHYTNIEFFNKSETLEVRQAVDQKKRVYCKQRNIKLIEIPYWDYDKIDKDYLFKLLN